jgi:Family of unknown function (DUF6527)
MSKHDHTPVTATKFEKAQWQYEGLPAGSFCLPEPSADGEHVLRYLYVICPCGCGMFMHLPIRTGPKVDGAWQWDGNTEQPTLRPSIRDLGGCRFHGHLTSGVWTFEPDSGVVQP